MDSASLTALCRLIRYFILISTTRAGSGHATSALSAVELATVLFFKHMRADLDNPDNPGNDRFILSKGHASPLLYSLYAAAGKVSEEEIMKLRTFDSPLEGHPSIRFAYTEVPTGSLGQGLSVGIGEALALRTRISNVKFQMTNVPKIYVLLGDGELAEGQVWEAIQCASYHKLNNLIVLVDVNRLGQSQETMYGTDIQAIARRIAAFGWRTYVVENGHDLELVDRAFSIALEKSSTSDMPAVVLCKTIKGKGVSFLEDKEGWHGIALKKEELMRALTELGEVDKNIRGIVQFPGSRGERGEFSSPAPKGPEPALSAGEGSQDARKFAADLSGYSSPISTRKAFGNALVRLGNVYPHVVVLDGDVQNSTYTSLFAKQYQERFFQMFIAEGNMISVALGMAKQGKQPVVSTFGCFLTRAADQLRMAALSSLPMIVNGTHGGVSIGADGPSQMGLEDIALFRALPGSTVVYPADAYATEALVEELLKQEKGIGYIRTTRPATPLIYSKDDKFPIGGSKIFSGKNDTITVVAAGITLHETLKAQKQLAGDGIGIRVIDCYCVKPIDKETLKKAAQETKAIIVVEDHYPEGGLGEAVASATVLSTSEEQPSHPKVPVIHLSVAKPPRSGTGEELLSYEGLSTADIIRTVHKLSV